METKWIAIRKIRKKGKKQNEKKSNKPIEDKRKNTEKMKQLVKLTNQRNEKTN